MVGILAALLVFLTVPFGASARSAAPASVTADAVSPPLERITAYTSTNWAGYVAQNDSDTYTGVGATWDVPAVTGSHGGMQSDATWIGIGGTQSDFLIQAGTQAIIHGGRVTYNAWYETLPDYQRIVPLPVHAGDSITGSLVVTAPDVWHLTLKNNTTGDSYETDITYHSDYSSAGWIEERPLIHGGNGLTFLPLDNFAPVHFTDAYAIVNGQRVSAEDAGAQSISMDTEGGVQLAGVSALSGGSFSIARSADTPSALAQTAALRPAVGRGEVLVVTTDPGNPLAFLFW